MRYVALFLLILLSLYFLFLKPYLHAKRIYYELSGVELSLDPLKLSVGRFYIYVPLRGTYLYFSLQGLSITAHKNLRIHLNEGALTLVSTGKKKKSAHKGSVPPKIVVPEFLKELSLEVDRFTFTYHSDRNVFLLIKGLELKDRKLSAEAEVRAGKMPLFVSLQGVELLEDHVRVGRVRVDSSLFWLEVSGSLSEEDISAEFILKGELNSVDTPAVKVSPVKLSGDGKANYRGITAELRASVEELLLKGKKSFEGTKAFGTLNLVFGKGLSIKGAIGNEEFSSSYSLFLGKEKYLKLKIKRFPVDSQLVGIGEPFFTWVGGDITVDFGKEEVEAYLRTEGIGNQRVAVGFSEAMLQYNYRIMQGKVDVAVRNPMNMLLSGHIGKGSFSSSIELRDLLFVGYGLSAFLHYSGSVSYKDVLKVEGKGGVLNIHFRDISLGDVSYKLTYEGKDIELTYRGKGLEGSLRGKVGESLLLVNRFRNYIVRYRGIELLFREASLDASVVESGVVLGVRVSSAEVKRENMVFPLEGYLNIEKGDVLRGEFSLLSRELKLGKSFSARDAHLRGRIEDTTVSGEYGAQKLLEGVYRISLRDMEMSTSGLFVLGELSVNYFFAGSAERGRIEVSALYSRKKRKHKLRGELIYGEGKVLAKLLPQRFKEGAFELSFGGITLEGSYKEGTLRLSESSLKILGQPALEVVSEGGYYNLNKGEVRLSLSLHRSVKGKAHISFLRNRGVEVLSTGQLDLRALSFFTATPVGGKAEGFLSYRLSYDSNGLSLHIKNGGRVITHSRYFTFPMESWLELRAIGENLSAFITLWKENSGLSANLGSLNLKDYYLYLVSRDMPVSYRGSGVNVNLKVSSEGWVNVRELKKVSLRLNTLLSGEVEVEKLTSGKKKSGRGGEGTEVELDINFESSAPIRVSLPEGYVYVKVMGWVGGSSQNPSYGIKVEFLSGELTYFGRKFYVRSGNVSLLKEEDTEESNMDISLVNPSQELTIFINLHGSLRDPNIVVWSEPPKSAQELLTKLIIGSTAEGIIPVAKALFKQLGYLGNIKSGLASLLGVDITLSTQTGSQGEIGVNVNIRKKIARALSIEYQQSTLKDPRATYYGGSVRLPGGTSFYGRVFSDNTSEIKLRFIRKFDF